MRVRADDPALPAPACAIVVGQIVCYDMQTASPRPISPEDRRVLDFAIAPDGNWVVYRTDDIVTIRGIYSEASLVIDSKAEPPTPLDLVHTTMIWAPDGLEIAYLVSNGFRVAFPAPDGTIQAVDIADRHYVNLRFSPGGLRLAAQAVDGNWSLFALHIDDDKLSVSPTGAIPQAADLAWLDDNSFILAAVAGGLWRLDANDLNKAPAWNVPNEHFTKLFSASNGQVFALHPDPGDTIGSAVAISPDGQVSALGTSKIDSQVEWGPDGQVMVYNTSGTPILVDRRDGSENILPLSQITRLIWAPPWPQLVQNVPLDADLYYIAPDDYGVRQVWQLQKGGLDAPHLLTRQTSNVLDYALSPDRTQIALAIVGQLITVPLEGDTPTAHLLALLSGRQNAQPVWRPNGQQIVYVDHGLYTITVDGVAAPKLAGMASDYPPDSYTYTDPEFSPDGQALLVKLTGTTTQSILLNLKDGTTQHADVPNLLLSWGSGGTLLGYFTAPSSSGRLIRLHGLTFTDKEVLVASGDLVDFRSADETKVLVLRKLGWKVGLTVVQFATVSGDNGDKLALHSLPIVLENARLSPTGRFAVGVQRIGTINQMVILDLQTGRKVRVLGTNDVSAIRWVS